MREFLQVYADLRQHGQITAPRGQRVLEIEDYVFLVPSNPITCYKARKFSANYLKKEFLWYLGANPYDDMITDHAQMWKDIRQPDGRFFSNYGQYWFGDQKGFDWVVNELKHDPHSRRAVIPMLNASHLFRDNKDVVCTESISFRIRNGKLNMSVNMRSQDAIWGMTNDVACFTFLQWMVAAKLGYEVGRYIHKVDSFHVYERHWLMLDKILSDGLDGFYTYHVPKITSAKEVVKLIHNDYDTSYPFTKWLLS